MTKKIFKLIYFILCLFYLVFFLLNSSFWKDTFIETCELWLYKVIVGIIPMYIISSIIITLPIFSNLLFKILKPLKLFENQKALSIFLVSFLCGNPTTSILVSKAYNNNEITLEQANHILNSSSHISFLFIILFFEKEISIILISSQIISTLILYLFYKNHSSHNPTNSTYNYLETINNIIEDLPLILLKILSSMIIINLIKAPFNLMNNNLLNIFLSFLEVTTGINHFVSLNINPFIFIILTSSILSLNGLAIILQVFNIIKKTRLSFKAFISGRFFHMLISTSTCLVEYLVMIFFF